MIWIVRPNDVESVLGSLYKVCLLGLNEGEPCHVNLLALAVRRISSQEICRVAESDLAG
jgi:hypothetical protein